MKAMNKVSLTHFIRMFRKNIHMTIYIKIYLWISQYNVLKCTRKTKKDSIIIEVIGNLMD